MNVSTVSEMQRQKLSIDASKMLPGLYQGSHPPEGFSLYYAKFSHLVLCAFELPRKPEDYPGVSVRMCPMDDCEIVEVDKVLRTAKSVADRVRLGKRVLVCCHMGLNRSGIVVGSAMRMLMGWNGKDVVDHMRSHRSEFVLRNKTFEATILGKNPEYERKLQYWMTGR